MKTLDLLPIGDVDLQLLECVRPALTAAFRAPCRILPPRLDPQFAFHAERGQYHSSELLQAMQHYADETAWRVLGITSMDLYIPILTFVFGEAQMGGPCSIVSYHRLQQQFYGFPPDATVLADRLVKEAVHELGHTFDLTHCSDYSCAMAPSHAVEWIDLKESTLCSACQSRAWKAVS